MRNIDCAIIPKSIELELMMRLAIFEQMIRISEK